MAIDVNSSFSVENGLSFNDAVFMFEGTDSPEVALADASIIVGSIYISYVGAAVVGVFQKTNQSPLTYIKFGASAGGDIDGGVPEDTYYANSAIIDGGTPNVF